VNVTYLVMKRLTGRGLILRLEASVKVCVGENVGQNFICSLCSAKEAGVAMKFLKLETSCLTHVNLENLYETDKLF